MGCICSIYKYFKNTNDDYHYKKLEQTEKPQPTFFHYQPYKQQQQQKYWICSRNNKHPITQKYCHCLMKWCQDNPIQNI